MSDETVTRLRDLATREAQTMPPGWPDAHDLYSKAADEIERLRTRAEAAEEVAEQAKTLYRETLQRAVAAEAERDRLRGVISGVKKHADEWCVSRMTGNPHLENEKGEKMWQAIRRASAMTAPIEGSAALKDGDRQP